MILTARYEDKRWIPRNGARRSPSRPEKASESLQRHVNGAGHGITNDSGTVKVEHSSKPHLSMKNVRSNLPSQVSNLVLFLLKLYSDAIFLICL